MTSAKRLPFRSLRSMTRTRLSHSDFFQVSVPQGTLFEYPNGTDGLIEVTPNGAQFEPGFQRQIIHTTDPVWVYKNWRGTYKTTPLTKVTGKGPDVVVSLIQNVGLSRLEVWYKGPKGEKIGINWGVKKYTEAPAKFFEGLRIKKAGDNYTDDEVNFLPNGSITLKPHAKGWWEDEFQKVEIKNFLDLSLDYFKNKLGYQFEASIAEDARLRKKDDDVAGEEDVSHGLDEDALLMVEVAVGAFVGALIIGLIGLWVYRVRSKRRVRSSSTISHQSSSDEVREEGLMEMNE